MPLHLLYVFAACQVNLNTLCIYWKHCDCRVMAFSNVQFQYQHHTVCLKVVIVFNQGWGVTCNLITKKMQLISYFTSTNIVIWLWMPTFKNRWLLLGLLLNSEWMFVKKKHYDTFLFSLWERRKFKFVPPERVWSQVGDHWWHTMRLMDYFCRLLMSLKGKVIQKYLKVIRLRYWVWVIPKYLTD